MPGPGRPFQKGQSGNPGGKKAIAPEVREALRELTPHAIEVLKAALLSEDEKVAMQAAKEVLDRNLGKPSQQLEMTGDGGGPVGIQIVVEGVDPDTEGH